jgi:hypothetical protein
LSFAARFIRSTSLLLIVSEAKDSNCSVQDRHEQEHYFTSHISRIATGGAQVGEVSTLSLFGAWKSAPTGVLSVGPSSVFWHFESSIS